MSDLLWLFQLSKHFQICQFCFLQLNLLNYYFITTFHIAAPKILLNF